VHDLVMRQRQDEILRKRVVQAEQMSPWWCLRWIGILAMYSAYRASSHVPFVAEPSPPYSTGRDTCGHESILPPPSLPAKSRTLRIEAAQEDRPLRVSRRHICSESSRGRPTVIEIQHGGDRIDAQAIDAVTLEPEQRVGDRKLTTSVRP